MLACTDGTVELERKADTARLHVARLEAQLDRAKTDGTEGWIAAQERALPDRGASTFTSTLAWIAASLPATRLAEGSEVALLGPYVTEPARVITSSIAHVRGMFEDLERAGFLVSFDSLETKANRTQVDLHTYNFVIESLVGTSTSALAPGPDEGGSFAGARNQLRADIRDSLRKIEKLEAKLKGLGFESDSLHQLSKAQNKASILETLRPTVQRAQKDLQMVLAALRAVGVTPARMNFRVRRGRRLCRIELRTDIERHRLARAAVQQGAATDVGHSEIVLFSGRVCNLSVNRGDGRKARRR